MHLHVHAIWVHPHKLNYSRFYSNKNMKFDGCYNFLASQTFSLACTSIVRSLSFGDTNESLMIEIDATPLREDITLVIGDTSWILTASKPLQRLQWVEPLESSKFFSNLPDASKCRIRSGNRCNRRKWEWSWHAHNTKCIWLVWMVSVHLIIGLNGFESNFRSGILVFLFFYLFICSFFHSCFWLFFGCLWIFWVTFCLLCECWKSAALCCSYVWLTFWACLTMFWDVVVVFLLLLRV